MSKFQNRRLALAMLRIHLTIASFRKIKMVGRLLRNTTLEVGRTQDSVQK